MYEKNYNEDHQAFVWAMMNHLNEEKIRFMTRLYEIKRREYERLFRMRVRQIEDEKRLTELSVTLRRITETLEIMTDPTITESDITMVKEANGLLIDNSFDNLAHRLEAVIIKEDYREIEGLREQGYQLLVSDLHPSWEKVFRLLENGAPFGAGIQLGILQRILKDQAMVGSVIHSGSIPVM
jgi:hypothetical protein